MMAFLMHLLLFSSMKKTDTIKELDKNTHNTKIALEFNEGQPRVFLSSNKTSAGCPLLHLNVKAVQLELIENGYSEDKVNQITGYIRGIVQHIVTKNLNQIFPYE